MRYGIKVIIGEGFADIFQGNCTMLGVPAPLVSAQDCRSLMDLVRENPLTQLNIDLESLTITCGGELFACALDNSAQKLFLSGQWDSTSMLLSQEREIRAKAAKLPYFNWLSVT